MKKRWLAALLLCTVPLAQAQEEIAQSPHDGLRIAHETQLNSGTLGIARCVSSTQSQASKKCPVACQINMPDTALTKADSCASRTWSCQWPKQAVSVSESCPAGWSGSIGKDRIYEVQHCGSKLQDTGQTSITLVGCTRTLTETSTTTCPTGGDWVGAGITKQRNIDQALNLDMSSTTELSAGNWLTVGVACSRVVNQVDYARCPGATPLCTSWFTQSSSTLISSTCAGSVTPTGSINVSITAITQHLSFDLQTPVTDAVGSPSATVVACTECTPGTKTFSTPGSFRFTIPKGVISMQVELWGAGGGAASCSGASGGYTNGKLNALVSGTQLEVLVGQGGTRCGGPTIGGGGGSQAPMGYCSASGGGRSAIRSSDDLMTAGGGGGSFGHGLNWGSLKCAGAGGGLSGETYFKAIPPTSILNIIAGVGGTQTAGGANIQNGSNNTGYVSSYSNGGHLFGGPGANCTNNCGVSGGGGGGGWYGGSGGIGNGKAPALQSGGGGGSGYCGGSNVTDCTTTTGAGSPVNTNGKVKITWTCN